MSTKHIFAALLMLVSTVCTAYASIGEARQHVGEIKCVTGKVLHVKVGAKGVHFVDFCGDQASCPFTVVVFPHY